MHVLTAPDLLFAALGLLSAAALVAGAFYLARA